MSNLKDLTNQGYEAFAKGDMETLTKLIADGAKWHVSGGHALSGTYDGRDNIFGFFAKLGQETGGSLDMSIKNINVLNDSLSQVIVSASAKRGEKSVNNFIEAHLARWENNQIVEFWGTYASDKTAQDFWGTKS